MSALTNSMVYEISAWKDNKVKICATQYEGVESSSTPANHKTVKFQLYDDDGLLTIPQGSQINLATIRPDGEPELIAGSIVDGDNAIIQFPITYFMTEIPGNIKGEIRIVTDSSVVKFHGINFCIFDGIDNSAIEQSEQFDALIRALQELSAITAGGEIATLDTVIEHGGTNPVASGIIYDYLNENFLLRSYANATFEKTANKIRDINPNRRTFTNEAYEYPSVAAVKDFAYQNFVTGDDLEDYGFIDRVPVTYTGDTDKAATETGDIDRGYLVNDIYINNSNGKFWVCTDSTEDDGTYTYTWDYRGLLYDVVELRPTVINYTLDSELWESGEQELNISGYTVTNKTMADIDITPEIANTLNLQNIVGLFIVNNDGVLTCRTIGKTPLDDITVQIELKEVNIV